MEPGRTGLRLGGMTRPSAHPALLLRRTVPAALCLALSVLLAACRGAGGQAQTLDGTWVLQAGSQGGVSVPMVDGHDITLVIDGSAVSGRACNLYSASITVQGSHITLSGLAMTEMACDEPIMAAEAAYHAALAEVDTASRRGDTLTLSGPDVTLRYDVQPPAADMPLIATHWVLETLISGEVASSTLGSPATLLLAPDGTASGWTGCRSFSASYVLQGDRLTLTDVSVEKVLCTRDLAAQDDLVMGVLTNGATIAVNAASLTLTAGDGHGLGYRAGSGSGGPGGGTAEPLDTGVPRGTSAPG